VSSATFDEANHLWRLRVGRGAITTRFLVTALGGFRKPKPPDTPPLAGFGGKTMHTAEWDHGHALKGERVAVIGTGATAVQLVPLLAEDAERLYVFQRTPIWVLPKIDFEVPGAVRFLFRRAPFLHDSIRLAASAAIDGGMVLG